MLIGHSTGGGEVVRYAAQHGHGRVSKIVTAGAVPPIMLKSDTNPHGTPIEALDAIREGVLKDRSQFYQDLMGSAGPPFSGRLWPAAAGGSALSEPGSLSGEAYRQTVRPPVRR